MNPCIKSSLAACLLLCASHVIHATSTNATSAPQQSCLVAAPGASLTQVNSQTPAQKHLSAMQAAILALTVQAATQESHFAPGEATWAQVRQEHAYQNEVALLGCAMTPSGTRQSRTSAQRAYTKPKNVCNSTKTKRNRRYSERD